MRRFVFFFFFLSMTVAVCSQSVTGGETGGAVDTLHRVTAFAEWQPALVTLNDGRRVTAPQANIFLKRSSLIYRNSLGRTMEALTDGIATVDIGGRHYARVDSLLCWQVDTVGQNALYCCTRIDLPSLRQQILNSRDMTDVQLNSLLMSTTTVDARDEDIDYPMINIYYYWYRGRWVRAHERALSRVVPKSCRGAYKTALAMPTFSWTDAHSLMEVLRSITEVE